MIVIVSRRRFAILSWIGNMDGARTIRAIRRNGSLRTIAYVNVWSVVVFTSTIKVGANDERGAVFGILSASHYHVVGGSAWCSLASVALG